MRIVFIGCVLFSKTILDLLIERSFSVVGIISKEDTGFNSDYFDLSLVAKEKDIPFIQTKNVNNSNILDWVSDLNPDIAYCFGWNSLIGKDFIDLFPKGVIGYHPASLPMNRGRHPIIWALVLGLKETSSSFFQMGEGTDDGDIVSQIKVEISENDTAESLYIRLMEISKDQVITFTKGFSEGTLLPSKQDHLKANTWRKRSKVDGIIDFRMSSMSIFNLVRALTKPYPGTIVKIGSDEYTVWKASLSSTIHNNFEPGKILEINDKKIKIKCGLANEAIILEEHSLPDTLEVGGYLI